MILVGIRAPLFKGFLIARGFVVSLFFELRNFRRSLCAKLILFLPERRFFLVQIVGRPLKASPEVLDSGVTIGPVPDRIGGAKLPGEVADVYRSIAGQPTYQYIASVNGCA